MPSAEIVSIGTELLLGQILDTNSQFISTELANLGLDCMFKSTVGDNMERIVSTLKLALNRSDVVITTGGLGPTADDLTHESIAELFKVQMMLDENVLAHIQGIFQGLGIKMVDSNKKQATRPAGANILANPTGTAPGIIWKLSEEELKRAGIDDCSRPKYIFTFPGVPSEMTKMWEETAAPFLAKEFDSSVVWSQELKHFGIGESNLAEKYADLLNGSNPTVAPLAGTGECRLRVSAKASSVDEAKRIAIPVIEKIKNESGFLCYGIDKDVLETVVARLLTERKLTLTTAESCTGGLVSKRLTDIPGSSTFIRLNLVTYANEAKQEILGVDEKVLKEHGAVSMQCAKAMAEGARKVGKADIGVGITGIAGPDGGTDEKPVGLVYISLASEQETIVIKKLFPARMGRSGIRMRASNEALNMVRMYLLYSEILRKDERVVDISVKNTTAH